MPLEYQIILAVALDLLIGDPRWLPHPVKYIGGFAAWMESPASRICRDRRIAGVMTLVVVVIATALAAYGLILAARLVHPVVGDIVGILLLYSGIAARDLIDHSTAVERALRSGDLQQAARNVRMICGRDTDRLDRGGVIRATVESVAENAVDGVTAPLFFAALGGPAAMLAYKAVNTLDSQFGYKNERYAEFGWASARVDDLLNFVPARLTAVFVPLAALLLWLRPEYCVRILRRDRLKHPSPNSGHTEAAFAGALGIRLGGLSYYGGVPSQKPTLGDPVCVEEPEHIRIANRLMLVTSGLVMVFLLVVRHLIL